MKSTLRLKMGQIVDWNDDEHFCIFGNFITTKIKFKYF